MRLFKLNAEIILDRIKANSTQKMTLAEITLGDKMMTEVTKNENA